MDLRVVPPRPRNEKYWVFLLQRLLPAGCLVAILALLAWGIHASLTQLEEQKESQSEWQQEARDDNRICGDNDVPPGAENVEYLGDGWIVFEFRGTRFLRSVHLNQSVMAAFPEPKEEIPLESTDE